MRKDTGRDSQYTYNENKTDIKECAIDESLIEEVFKDDMTDKDEEEGKLEIFNILENIKNNKKYLSKGPQSNRDSEIGIGQ